MKFNTVELIGHFSNIIKTYICVHKSILVSSPVNYCYYYFKIYNNK